MTGVIQFIADYQTWLYLGLGLGMAFYLMVLVRASQKLGRVTFGLERGDALSSRNGALAMLIVMFALAVSVFLLSQAIIPAVTEGQPTPGPAAVTAFPSPTPITAGQPILVDNTGCNNPLATVTQPQPNDKLAGAVEVHGTADIENFAFYKFEISGVNTNGAWVTLGAGVTPTIASLLGSFDASVHQSGDYAFRLVVTDNMGNFPPPCVIPVTLLAIPKPP